MTYDLALTVGLEATDAMRSVAELNSLMDTLPETAKRSGQGAGDNLARALAAASEPAVAALQQVATQSGQAYSQVAAAGAGAWAQIGQSADAATAQQLAGLQQVVGAAQAAAQTVARSTYAGTQGFNAVTNDRAQAESNLALFYRLQQGGSALQTGDLVRAQNLGVANSYGIAGGRLEQAIALQEEALRVILRRAQLNGRADGGAVNAGQAYIVGERGAEVFIPQQNGRIDPSVAPRPNQAAITINIMAAADPIATARAVAQQLERQQDLALVT